jgi:hypothetical protein
MRQPPIHDAKETKLTGTTRDLPTFVVAIENYTDVS